MDESKQILTALARLEENVKNMNSKMDGFTKVSELALQIEQSTKSAHNRLDDLKSDFAEKMVECKKDYEEKISIQKEGITKLEGHITWLWRAVGTAAIGFIFSLVMYFITK
ncbi:hypothetical protein MEZE111188_01855 [Mesobacillus zeae]